MEYFIKKLIRKLFDSFGYSIVKKRPMRTDPLPPPPNTIPEKLVDEFTMDDKIPVLYQYFDESTPDMTGIHNTAKKYKKIFRQLKWRQFVYYEREINAFYDALRKYPLDGKSVIVWGLAGCNCEAISVWSGAAKVYVVDYNKPVCDHEKIEVLTHEEFKRQNIKADIAFSYSSFEHDGLGRYGDPIAPNGDLLAMKVARDALTDSGILFFGVPLGRDALRWNSSRVYGAIRLPMMLQGWHCLDVYNVYKDSTSPFDMPLGKARQCLMILQKIENPFPDDKILTGHIENSVSDGSSHSLEMLSRINKMIRDYKKRK